MVVHEMQSEKADARRASESEADFEEETRQFEQAYLGLTLVYFGHPRGRDFTQGRISHDP